VGVLRDRIVRASLLPILARVAPVALAVVLSAVACDDTKVHAGHGVIHEVSLEDGQVLIAHDDMPGLMPAMTMSFSIYDKPLLESLRPGDVIDFELTAQRGSFFITAASVVGQVKPEEGWSRMGDGLVPSDPAPSFALTDPAGETVSLESLSGQTVLLDFIFTRCPGPCPILTSRHVSVQRALSPEIRERTHFVSISIDPDRDTPADLEAYGLARGADLADWSFLTGPSEEVEPIVAAYSVGTTRKPNGDIEHVVATFLIDATGRIVKRYLGLDHEPEKMAADISAVVLPSNRAGG
jgi:protein SCO1/2